MGTVVKVGDIWEYRKKIDYYINIEGLEVKELVTKLAYIYIKHPEFDKIILREYSQGFHEFCLLGIREATEKEIKQELQNQKKKELETMSNLRKRYEHLKKICEPSDK